MLNKTSSTNAVTKLPTANKKSSARAEMRARYLFRELAQKKKWKIGHVQNGGDFLEENEIARHFPDIGLGGELPDFLLAVTGRAAAVVEIKNELGKLGTAIQEAVDYADKINKTKKHKVRVAIGFAGEVDKGYGVKVNYLTSKGWVPLQSGGKPLTAVPSKHEIEHALIAQDGTTNVSVPEQAEFIDAAMELGALLRLSKVEPGLRPTVIGAFVAAMYQGTIDISEAKALASVNALCKEAIESIEDIGAEKKRALIATLKLDKRYDIARFVGRIVSILERLNVKAVLQTGVDFLGMFYEAFLRYGNDNNNMGIVFTPRHITRFCVDLVGVGVNDRVIDVAAGTGGFLVAAFDRMKALANNNAKQLAHIRESLAGFDTNHQIWALASLNMFFRGDGKSHIQHGSCLTAASKAAVKHKFSRAFLNPPFSQEGEPERDFIDASMHALEPDGLLAAVVFSSIFASDENKLWRSRFLSEHTLLGMISLPEDLFYPTAAPTSIMIAKAHMPHSSSQKVFVAKILDDGHEKLKGKRIRARDGQMTHVLDQFHRHLLGQAVQSEICAVVSTESVTGGHEWSPENWLPQTHLLIENPRANYEEMVLQELFRAVAHFPRLASGVLRDFGSEWAELPTLKYGMEAPLSEFFEVINGKSAGEKNYPGGEYPYVSSGDATNSIVNLVESPQDELFIRGGVTITAFGQACIQPWPYIARGNGGSSVRILVPKYRMTVRELIWFVAQINMQRWRFFYGRMAIKGRLEGASLKVKSPSSPLPDGKHSLFAKLTNFDTVLQAQSKLW